MSQTYLKLKGFLSVVPTESFFAVTKQRLSYMDHGLRSKIFLNKVY